MQDVETVIKVGSADLETIERILSYLKTTTEKSEKGIVEQVDKHPIENQEARKNTKRLITSIFQVFYTILDSVVTVDSNIDPNAIN